MTQGENSQPGERRCPDCGQRWYSAALLHEDDASCPACGATLEKPMSELSEAQQRPER